MSAANRTINSELIVTLPILPALISESPRSAAEAVLSAADRVTAATLQTLAARLPRPLSADEVSALVASAFGGTQ